MFSVSVRTVAYVIIGGGKGLAPVGIQLTRFLIWFNNAFPDVSIYQVTSTTQTDSEFMFIAIQYLSSPSTS